MSIPFYITTGKGNTYTRVVDSNNVYSLSSFTGMPVKLSVLQEDIPATYKKDFIIFEINDKFVLKGNNSEFNFPLPGVYKIKLYTADSDGEAVGSFTTYLTSFNYITDTITPAFSSSNGVYNDVVSTSANNPDSLINSSRFIPSTIVFNAGAYNPFPLCLVRYNTWQLAPSLSANNYNINLYCDRSKSVNYLAEKDYYTHNLLNYPIWQFTTDGPLPNGGQRPTFINTLSTSTENIYLTYNGITGVVSTVSGANSIFCGTSGYNNFYFKDDSINYSSDVLYFTQNLIDIPLRDYLLDGKTIQAFEGKLPIINNSSATLSAVIALNYPQSIGFSYNGLEENFPQSIFNGSQYPMFIGIKDSYNNFLKYYPKISLVGLNDPLTANTVKVVLLSAGSTTSSSSNAYDPEDLTLYQYSFSSLNIPSINNDTLSSFAVATFSADFVKDFNFSGYFKTLTINSSYLTRTVTNIFNPGVLSATGIFVTNSVSANIGGLQILNYYPNNIVYDINKINENFDYTGTLKSYAFMPSLIEQTYLYDYFFSYIAGDENSSPNEFGKRIYEKIANFTSNVSDLDKANVNELYSLYKQIGYTSKNYELNFPSNLQRFVDMLSIKYDKLIGMDTGFNYNYNANIGIDNTNASSNLGAELTQDSIINSGQNIVINQHFKNKFYTITPTPVSISNSTLSAYASTYPESIDATFGGLSSYPLSAYENNWNWGLPSDVDWEDHNDQHDFYLQAPTDVNNVNKIENTVDWSNFLTTLSSLQHDPELYSLFTKEGGLMEQYFENELRKGVGLL